MQLSIFSISLYTLISFNQYCLVDKDMKKFKISPLFPYRESWDFNKKEEYNNIIKNWHMTFQALDLKS